MIEKIEQFVRECCYQKLLEAAREGRTHVNVDYNELDRFDPVLSEVLLRAPNRFFTDLEATLRELDLGTGQKHKITFRFEGVPDEVKIRIKDLRSEHLGKLLKIDCMVRRASEVMPEMQNAIFECPDCGSKMEVLQTQQTMTYPNGCDCGRKRGFKFLDHTLHDARYISVEDNFEMTMGERPGTIQIFLKDDLTTPKMQRKTDPGARLEITGILREKPKKIDGVRAKQLEMFLEANYIRTIEQDFEEIIITPEDEARIKEFAAKPDVHKILVRSIAPSIYGLNEVKESILMQLFGGVKQTLPDGSHIRGDIHLLLVGDPSVGKTQLLKLVSNFMPRGRYVSGKGTSAAGLCMTPETLVSLSDGRLVQIGDLVENELRRGKKAHGEGIEIAENPTSLRVFAFDSKSLKVRPLNVTQYWKVKSPQKLVHIKTRSGREVTVTPHNPIPIIRDGGVIWERAENLRPGSFIAAPRRTVVTETSNPYILNYLDDTAHLTNGKIVIDKILAKATETKTIRDFAKEVGVPEDNLYYSWRSGGHSPQLAALQNMCSAANMNLDGILPEELVLTQHRGHEVTLPKMITEDMMYPMGLVAGDGDIEESAYGGRTLRLHSADEELLAEFSRISNILGLGPSAYKHPERIEYRRISSKLLGIVAARLGIPSGEKSHKLRVTEELSRLPNNLIAAYLSGLFDTDGSVIERTGGASYVDLTSVSQDYLRGIQILLLRFGILSKLRGRKESVSQIRCREVRSGKKYVLEIKGLEHLKLFERQIGFRLSRKKQKLTRVVSSIGVAHTNVDLIPEIHNILKQARMEAGISAKTLFGYKAYEYERGERKPSRQMLSKIVGRLNAMKRTVASQKLETFSASDILWDEIKEASVIDSPCEYVYDLTVEEEHSFVANGLIVHNTATVVRDEEVMGGWVLEAGAVVLSNKSVLAIDEFDKMSREDQINLHEAMSVQSYHYNTPLLLADGSTHKMGELVEKLLVENAKDVIPGNGCFILYPKNDALRVLSTDFSKMFPSKVIRVSKHTAPEYFYDIASNSGRQVLVTPEHPCWIIRDGSIVHVPADKLKTGDWIPVPTKLPIDGQLQNIQISQNIRLPQIPTTVTPELCGVLGYLASEGGYELNRGVKNGINFTNSSPVLLNDFQRTVKSLFGLEPYVQHKRGRTMLRYISKGMLDFVKTSEPSLIEKSRLKKVPESVMKSNPTEVYTFLRKAFDGDGGIVHKPHGLEIAYTTISHDLARGVADLLLRAEVPASIRRCKTPLGKPVYRVNIAGKQYLHMFVEKIGFTTEHKNKEIRDYVSTENYFRKTVFDAMPTVGKTVIESIRSLGLSQKPIVGWTLGSYENKLHFTKPVLGRILDVLDSRLLELKKDIMSLPQESPDLRRIRRKYRIEVSEIAKEMKVSTGLVYHIEKGGSAQRAAAYRNTFSKAMKERLSVEFDLLRLRELCSADISWVQVKNIRQVKNEDQKWVYDITVPNETFIGNGMVLHNTVSISKATIQATLPSQTAILAGCNPKFSRFDPGRSIAEQIDIPDTLMSRFDLKFVLLDRPNREHDEKLVEHVIASRLDREKITPELDANFLRKYIAYGRQTVQPMMTRKTAAMFKNFFVELRSRQTGENRPIPITLRQYEALMRVAEASARIRLANEVNEEDAERAIRLMKYSIVQLGFDAETGELDIDKAEGGTPAAQRNRIRTVMETLEELEKSFGKTLPEQEIIAALEDKGIDEVTALTILREMKHKGMLFEPRAGHLQKI